MHPKEAEKLAQWLDQAEADLVGIQSTLFRVREALQKIVGHPVGFQYNEPNERSRATPTT